MRFGEKNLSLSQKSGRFFDFSAGGRVSRPLGGKTPLLLREPSPPLSGPLSQRERQGDAHLFFYGRKENRAKTR